MPTSGETDWPLTAGTIVTQALVELGVLSSGEEPEAAEMDDALVRLNSMLKMWAGEANLFREESGTLTITGGTGAVTLGQEVREINSLRHIVSATNHRPLQRWNRDQYYVLPNRAAVGNPTVFTTVREVDGTTLRIWPVPATNQTFHVDYSRTADTVTDQSETVDIPQEWQEAVILGLAWRCANMFGAAEAKPNTVQDIRMRAEMAYNRLLDRDRPESYFFEPWDGFRCA